MRSVVLAMFSPVEILVVLAVAVICFVGLALVAWLAYALVRRAARDGARDARKKTNDDPRTLP